MHLEMGEHANVCLGCYSENLHLTSVRVLKGNDVYKTSEVTSVTSKDLSVTNWKIDTPNRLREMSVYMTFSCEQCDATTKIYYADHKGSIYTKRYL